MIAKTYLETFKIACVFIDWNGETGVKSEETACTKPAVAVYVRDDDTRQAQWVCEHHAKKAEREGDGPVFWMKEEAV